MEAVTLFSALPRGGMDAELLSARPPLALVHAIEKYASRIGSITPTESVGSISIRPTEKDSSSHGSIRPTEIDSSSDGSITPRDAQHFNDGSIVEYGDLLGDFCDSLLNLAQKSQVCTPTPTNDALPQSFDSQLIEDEDPMCSKSSDRTYGRMHRLLQMEMSKSVSAETNHWSDDPRFVQEVKDRLKRCDHAWCSSEELLEMPLSDFAVVTQRAIDFISSQIIGRWAKFKIGITEDPWIRWTHCDFGHLHDNFDRMFVIYAAPISKWKMRGLTRLKSKS